MGFSDVQHVRCKNSRLEREKFQLRDRSELFSYHSLFIIGSEGMSSMIRVITLVLLYGKHSAGYPLGLGL